MSESAPSYLGSPASQSECSDCPASRRAKCSEKPVSTRYYENKSWRPTLQGGYIPRRPTSQEAHILGRLHHSGSTHPLKTAEEWGQSLGGNNTPKASNKKSFPKSSQELHSQTSRAALVITRRPCSHRAHKRGLCVDSSHSLKDSLWV